MNAKSKNRTPMICFFCADPRLAEVNKAIKAAYGFDERRDIEIKVCGGAFRWDSLQHSLRTAKKVFGLTCPFRIILTVHSDCKGAPSLPDNALEETCQVARAVCRENPLEFISIDTGTQTYAPVSLPLEEWRQPPEAEVSPTFWQARTDQWMPHVTG